ncbi:helix-turn-helix domain-containing protein [Streptomyces sp. NPDC048611]|uniref:MmyB family transcriptional regulator n=1 Tax=Streptomyces sp. NPDC048611 TaxID=3155635 RepID=UPI00343E17A8
MNKDALNGLLESRRALIGPTTVGLDRPQRQGRRAAGLGLSQEQLDQVAGYAVRTYNRLVNGKIDDPSFDLLRAYARALRLTEQEWVAMCRFARGDDPTAPLHPRSGKDVPGMWADAVDGIRHMAYVTDQSYNLLAHNTVFAALFADRQPPPNMMEWMLLHPAARHTLTDWATVWAPYVLPQLRGARAILPDDCTLAAIEQAVIADPDCGPMYEERTTAQVHPDGQERPLLHPLLGPGWANICAAEPLSSPNARLMIVMFYPGVGPSHIRRPHLRA